MTKKKNCIESTNVLLSHRRTSDNEILCIFVWATTCLLVYFIVPPNTKFRVEVFNFQTENYIWESWSFFFHALVAFLGALLTNYSLKPRLIYCGKCTFKKKKKAVKDSCMLTSLGHWKNGTKEAFTFKFPQLTGCGLVIQFCGFWVTCIGNNSLWVSWYVVSSHGKHCTCGHKGWGIRNVSLETDLRDMWSP